MNEIRYFVPGEPADDEGVVAHLRWPIPAHVARTYAEAYTAPGESILLPYCQGPAAVREIVAAGRRALALNFDPALMLLVQTAMAPLPVRALDAAVARLGDSPKQGMPLRHVLDRLYATTCPACLRPAVADYFVWDRDQGQPVAKQLRCPACAWDGRAGIDAEDRERLADTPARGMHYHYILDRVAPQPQSAGLRARLEYLLELHSPRNLYALAELTLKIESLFADEATQRALKVLLLDCLDRCSSLASLPGSTARRWGLARPGRFLERNVWRAFEAAVARFQALATPSLPGRIDTPTAFRASAGGASAFVGQGLVRDLPDLVPPRSLKLVLVSPPSLDSATWALSYLWGAWLLGAEAAASLVPLLRQRAPDPPWYAQVMVGSLQTLGSLLADEGRLVLVLTEQRPALVEALLLAASQARLGVASLVQCGADSRLELTPTLPPPAPLPDEPLEALIGRAALAAFTGTLAARGEPAGWRTLHAAAQFRLAETGLLARAAQPGEPGPSPLDRIAERLQAALEHPALVRLPGAEGAETTWWLAHPAEVAAPLSDRVEAAAYEVLHGTLALSEIDFQAALYARFPGPLTPDAELLATCLRAYGREPTPGYWQLRKEDLPGARQSEGEVLVSNLLKLGQRLGYRAEPWLPFDAVWFEGTQPRAAFAVRWSAAVGEALALSAQAAGANPYLVIPGGRAALVSYKLAHNPLWRAAVEEAGWRFIKYRHVRQLAAQAEVDEYALRTIIGLDPIVEQEGAQLPLF
jgi:hypothetical protein